MRTGTSSFPGVYYRFTKVRPAGRFERGPRKSG